MITPLLPSALLPFAVLVMMTLTLVVVLLAVPENSAAKTWAALAVVVGMGFSFLSLPHELKVPATAACQLLIAIGVLRRAAKQEPVSRFWATWRWLWSAAFAVAAIANAALVALHRDWMATFLVGLALNLIPMFIEAKDWREERARKKAETRYDAYRVWLDFPEREAAQPSEPELRVSSRPSRP